MLWIIIACESVEKKLVEIFDFGNRLNVIPNQIYVHASDCSSEANDCSTGSSKFGIIFNIDLSLIEFIGAIIGLSDGKP